MHFTLERALCPFMPESKGSLLEDVVQGPDCCTPRLILHAPHEHLLHIYLHARLSAQ